MSLIAVNIPIEHAPTAQGQLRRHVEPKREEWQPDGSWTGLFDVSEECVDEFYGRVERLTDGSAETRKIESEDDIGGPRMAFYLF